MSRPIARRSWRGIVLGAVLLFGVSACATSGAAPSAPPPSTSTAVPTEDSADADAEVAAEVEVESAADAAATVETEAGSWDDAVFGDVAARPDPLAELGIPFYPCTREMTAMPGTDPLFVGEYVTDHELIIVEAAIVAQFDASDWEITDSTVEGDNAIRTAQMPGYSLVVVVGPERTNPDSSSIHYTLRAS